jgi:hypothetical protein
MRPGEQSRVEELYPKWRAAMEERHIIASVRNPAALEAAAKAPTLVVYLLFGNPLNICDMLGLMRDRGKLYARRLRFLASNVLYA